MTLSALHSFLEAHLNSRIAAMEKRQPSEGERREFREICRATEWIALNHPALTLKLLSLETPIGANTLLPEKVRVTLEISL